MSIRIVIVLHKYSGSHRFQLQSKGYFPIRSGKLNVSGYYTGIRVFTEETVGTAFAMSVGAVSIVNKNYHSAAYKFRQSPIPVTK